MTIPDIIIAIDGYSSTGKSSFAKLVANEFSFLYLDSGALYRAVTFIAQRQGLINGDDVIDYEGLRLVLENADVHFDYTDQGSKTFIGTECVEKEIRSLGVSSQVSPIAAVPFVRSFVDKKLREFGIRKRLVMDGRDIGTTVFPNAEIKIFMTAGKEIRAKRRFDELTAKGESPVFEEVMKNIEERDFIDSHRENSPLCRAADAFVLDNSNLSLKEEVIWLKGLIQGKFGILE